MWHVPRGPVGRCRSDSVFCVGGGWPGRHFRRVRLVPPEERTWVSVRLTDRTSHSLRLGWRAGVAGDGWQVAVRVGAGDGWQVAVRVGGGSRRGGAGRGSLRTDRSGWSRNGQRVRNSTDVPLDAEARRGHSCPDEGTPKRSWKSIARPRHAVFEGDAGSWLGCYF
jgi:hypothetical protein